MYSPDLSTACEVASGEPVRAIGWLERGRSFPTGSVDQRFLAVLQKHVEGPGRWLAVVSCGVHFCDLGGCPRAGGSQYVIIPSATCLYVAPDLVVHYIADHRYSPPNEFVAAVLACPEQSSDAYVDLLLPFAGIWSLDADGVRRIASRRVRTEPDPNQGNFRW
jgi:hypothetical protein